MLINGIENATIIIAAPTTGSVTMTAAMAKTYPNTRLGIEKLRALKRTKQLCHFLAVSARQ